MASQSYDISGSDYRVTGTITATVSGNTINWTITYTTYEYIRTRIKENGIWYYCFAGLTNSNITFKVGTNSAITRTSQFTGYAYGTHSSRSSEGWLVAKTEQTITTTSTLTGSVPVVITIVSPNVSGTKTFTFDATQHISIKVDGAMKNVSKVQVKVDGTMKDVTHAWVKVSDALKQIF